jgi:hypothetical protein
MIEFASQVETLRPQLLGYARAGAVDAPGHASLARTATAKTATIEDTPLRRRRQPELATSRAEP